MRNDLQIFGTAVGLTILTLLTGCNKSPSKEQLETAGEECRSFIAKEMTPDIPRAPTIETTINDSWIKDGKLVFEVGYREQYSTKTSYSIRKCVVDEEKGTMSSPSPLNDSKWDK